MKIAEDDIDIYDTKEYSIVTGFITECTYHGELSSFIILIDESRNTPTTRHYVIMAKTPAERSREYRARKKALTNTTNQHLKSECSASVLKKNNMCIVNQESSQQSITDDEDVTRENNHLILYKYLTDQKNPDSKQIGNNHQSTVVQVDVQGQSINQNNVTVLKKKLKTAKTSAERSREYRARKKALKNAVIK